MRVYGSCIEPGGMELEDEWWQAPCPDCGKKARHGHVQQLEGGCINAYFPISCKACGLLGRPLSHRHGVRDTPVASVGENSSPDSCR